MGAGIMLVVVLHTFKWFSVGIVVAAFLPETLRKRFDSKYFRLERKIPRSEAIVIVVVTLMSIFTNIAYADTGYCHVWAVFFLAFREGVPGQQSHGRRLEGLQAG